MRQNDIRAEYNKFVQEYGITQMQVAGIIDVDFRDLSKFKNDRKDLPMDKLKQLKRLMTKYAKTIDSLAYD